jgi:putative transposase
MFNPVDASGKCYPMTFPLTPQSITTFAHWQRQGIWQQIHVVWVAQGYSGPNFRHAVQQVCGQRVRVEVIERESKQFEVLPKRWIVERSFGWLNRYRRLSKDYELYTQSSEAMIYGSFIRLMTRRLAA